MRFTTLSCFIILLYYCGPGKPGAGHISKSSGDEIFIQRGSEKFRPGYFSKNFYLGDLITTGPGSKAILTFNDGEAILELQPASELRIMIYSKYTHEILLQKGSAWLKINQLPAQRKFRLRSADFVTGSAENKLYVQRLAQKQWLICQCEGHTRFYHFRSNFKEPLEPGDFVYLAENQAARISQAEALKSESVVKRIHEHSRLGGSPLGEKSVADDQQRQKLLSMLRAKIPESRK